MSLPQNTTVFDLALNCSIENVPYLSEFLNLSLWPQRSDTSFLANSNGTGVDLANQLKSNNFSYLGIALVDSILDRNSTQALIYCTYPLRGQYDRLPRYLFYGAVIVAVIGVHFTWLAEIAFNVIIVYSLLVAIHLFNLLATYGFNKAYYMGDWLDGPPPEGRETTQSFGDVDVFGILPILWISVVMLVPMLAWSSTFRSYNARLVIQAWAFCIFIAFIFNLVLWKQYPSKWTKHPYSEYDDALGSWGVLAATALALATYLILLVEPYITRGILSLHLLDSIRCARPARRCSKLDES